MEEDQDQQRGLVSKTWRISFLLKVEEEADMWRVTRQGVIHEEGEDLNPGSQSTASSST